MTTATAPEAASARRAARRTAAENVGDEPLETLPGPDEEALAAEAHQALLPEDGGGTLEAFEDMVVREADTEVQAPVIHGGLVVYLGSSHRHSRSLRGTLAREDYEVEPAVTRKDPKTGKDIIVRPAVMETTKSVITSGDGSTNQVYDFSLRTTRGNLIVSRMMPPYQEMPDGAGGTRRVAVAPHLRGKAVISVEHPEHLRYFHLFRDSDRERTRLYQVLIPRRSRGAFMNYMADVDRKIGRERAEEEYTIGARASAR